MSEHEIVDDVQDIAPSVPWGWKATLPEQALPCTALAAEIDPLLLSVPISPLPPSTMNFVAVKYSANRLGLSTSQMLPRGSDPR
jgi:hypothetical protein